MVYFQYWNCFITLKPSIYRNWGIPLLESNHLAFTLPRNSALCIALEEWCSYISQFYLTCKSWNQIVLLSDCIIGLSLKVECNRTTLSRKLIYEILVSQCGWPDDQKLLDLLWKFYTVCCHHGRNVLDLLWEMWAKETPQ